MDFLKVAEEAARLGGGILLDWRERFTAREKSPANLVTEADLAAQQAIHSRIRDHFPDHQFLGEENLSEVTDSPYRWIIDPLDGTSNYVHGFPYYAVSIGLEEADRIIAGAIYDPNRDEMFSAALGAGATLNGRPMRVSQVTALADAMCMASLPIKAPRNHQAVRKFINVLEAAQTVQRSGSAALNLSSVACGRIDAFWSTSLSAWDMAAGVLLVTEAGGAIGRTDGETFSVHNKDVLAWNGHPGMRDELLQRLALE